MLIILHLNPLLLLLILLINPLYQCHKILLNKALLLPQLHLQPL